MTMTSILPSIEALTPEQLAFLGSVEKLTDEVVGTLAERDQLVEYTAQRNMTYVGEFLGSDNNGETKGERRRLLAHKIAQYFIESVLDGSQANEDVADSSTIADSIIEGLLAYVSNPAATSKSIAKKRASVVEWFKVPLTELSSETLGCIAPATAPKAAKNNGGIGKLIARHNAVTEQRIAEARRNAANAEGAEPSLIHESDSFSLVELTTKEHLAQESVVTGHCIGTSTSYSKALEVGKARFFSIRVNQADASSQHYSIEYVVASHSIKQIKTSDNKAVVVGGQNWEEVFAGLGVLMSKLARDEKPPKVLDIKLPENTLLTRQGQLVELEKLANLDASDVLFGSLSFSDEYDLSSRPSNLADIINNSNVDVNYFGNSNELLALILEGVRTINGYANFARLNSAEGLTNLAHIGGDAYFDRLTSAEGLTNLAHIGSYANFDRLTSAEGLTNLAHIGGDAYFDRLTSAEGLTNLAHIGGYANFARLTSAEVLNRSLDSNKVFLASR